MSSIDVCIPTYRPDENLRKLIVALLQQSIPVRHILLVNTDESQFDAHLLRGFDEHVVKIWHISQELFDHGYARDFLAKQSDADFLLYMTQDVMPVDRHLTRELMKAFADEQVSSAYARQLPKRDCRRSEKLTRQFNYPAVSDVKAAKDLHRLGIKLYFCSDVCAMYRRSVYEELGGFVHDAIFNEDMVYAAAVIDAGYKIAYCADALVRHSHNYTLRQYFSRSFDMAVSQKRHSEIFERARSEEEGAGMALTVLRQLLQGGHILSAVEFVFSCGAKYLGYKLGKEYERLPKKLCLACTASPWWFCRER